MEDDYDDAKMKEENQHLKNKLDEKDNLISLLEDTVESLRDENGMLKEENSKLKEENNKLNNELSSLRSDISTLHKNEENSRDKIKELTRRVSKDSTNSSKPPSSDGLNKRPTKSMREKTDRKRGGQPGHVGHGIVISRDPDEYVQHYPPKCESCSRFEECKSKSKFVCCVAHTVIEAVVSTKVVKHQAMKVECPYGNLGVDDSNVGSFPECASANIQYGDSFKSLSTLLNTFCAVSYDHISVLFRNLFDTSISAATVKSMVSECSEKITPAMEMIRKKIIDSPVCNCDETGISVNGKIHWIHDSSTPLYTYQTVSQKRGYEGIVENNILQFFKGIVVHDCFLPYWRFEGIEHAICNAHISRELQSNIEVESEHTWSRKFLDLLKSMLSSKKSSIERGLDSLKHEQIEQYSEQYDENMRLANEECPEPPDPTTPKRGRKKKGVERSLIERLCKLKDAVMLFIRDFRVPFDNNQAERDQRNVKTKMKISGCFRTLDGAKEYLVTMSYLSTANKHGINSVVALNRALNNDFKFLD